MIKNKINWIFVTLIILMMNVNEHSYGQVTDSIEHYIELAGRNNPRIKSDFLKYKSSLQRIPQAGAYPDPTLDIGFFLKPMDIIDGKQVADFKLMQMFPWFGTQKATRTEAEQMAKMAYEEFRLSVNNLYLDVYTKWYELSSLQQQLKNSKENKDLLLQLEKLAERKFSSPTNNSMGGSTGGGGMSDVLRIQLEVAELDNTIESIASELNAKKTAFNALLNQSAQNQISVPDTIIQTPYVFNVTAVMVQITNGNPMLKMIVEEELAYKAKAEADKKMSYPTLGIGVQYSLINKRSNMLLPVSDMNGMDMFMPMVSISLPIFRGKYKAQQKESELAILSTVEKYEDTRNSLEAQVYQVKYELDDAARKVELYNKQTELAQTTYKLLVQEFVSGRSDLTNLIQVHRQLIDYTFKKADATARYNTVVASIRSLISFNTPEHFNTK
ncbi:MAG: TolC family protein [Bacilli bacterium]|nr:TolC family protein [Bacilli bacterium]